MDICSYSQIDSTLALQLQCCSYDNNRFLSGLFCGLLTFYVVVLIVNELVKIYASLTNIQAFVIKLALPPQANVCK